MTRNVHTREIRRDPEWIRTALERIAEPDSELWPRDAWPPLILDRPLAVGAVGGHGPIPYSVVAYEPGRRLAFEFDPAFGLRGTHGFDVTPGAEPGVSVLRHEINGRLSPKMVLVWTFAIRWLHDALIEDLLDHAEFAPEDLPPPGAKWTFWVRLLRRRAARRRSAEQKVAAS